MSKRRCQPCKGTKKGVTLLENPAGHPNSVSYDEFILSNLPFGSLCKGLAATQVGEGSASKSWDTLTHFKLPNLAVLQILQNLARHWHLRLRGLKGEFFLIYNPQATILLFRFLE